MRLYGYAGHPPPEKRLKSGARLENSASEREAPGATFRIVWILLLKLPRH